MLHCLREVILVGKQGQSRKKSTNQGYGRRGKRAKGNKRRGKKK